MTKMPKPTLESKRKLAEAVTDEPPEPDQPPTKLRKEIKQRMSQLDGSIIIAKDRGYHAQLPKERLESLAVNERGDIYPTILPSLCQSSVAPPKRSLRLQSNLCTRCAKIDLDALLSRPHKTQAGQLAKNLSPVPNWKIDSCALCSLLSSTIDLRYWPSGRKYHSEPTHPTKWEIRHGIQSARTCCKLDTLGGISFHSLRAWKVLSKLSRTKLRRPILKPLRVGSASVKRSIRKYAHRGPFLRPRP
jgi:hypothetical protein